MALESPGVAVFWVVLSGRFASDIERVFFEVFMFGMLSLESNVNGMLTLSLEPNKNGMLWGDTVLV